MLKQSPFAAATLIAASVAALAMPLTAQQRGERLPRQCMEEIRNLCADDAGGNRGKIRECVREKFNELSDECAAAVRDRAGQRGSAGNAQRERREPAASNPYAAAPKIDRTVIYGDHLRQQVDVFTPENGIDEGPLVVFIHGGAWTMGSHKAIGSKPQHFNDNGYYFASAGYRLLPDSPVEQQASDIGEALRSLRGQAQSIGFNADQIVLMGHSAGAHLAALVATDPSYAGEAFGAIKGVVLLDGAGYDVTARIAQAGPRDWQIYNTAFGPLPERRVALSPVTHIGAADAPNWLALYVEEREEAREQSQMLVSALSEAGVSATALPIAGTDHGRMNRELGTAEGAAQTEAVDAFLERVFG